LEANEGKPMSATLVTAIIAIAVIFVIIAAILMIGVLALQKPKEHQSGKDASLSVSDPSK
jgi:preprotein translocase subunit SecG